MERDQTRRMTILKILTDRDNGAIPRQLLQLVSVPFLGIGIMTPWGLVKKYRIGVEGGGCGVWGGSI